MAVGFRVRNSNNILQIDGEYQNMELIYKANLTLSQADVLGYYNDVTPPANQPNALLAIHDTGSGCYVQKLTNGNYRIYTDRSATSANRVIEYFFFGNPDQTVISGGVGFKVRNPNNGAILFSSQKRYFRVQGIAFQQINPNTEVSQAFPGKKIAILQNMCPQYMRIESGGTPQQPIIIISAYRGTMRINQNGYPVVENRLVSQFGGPGTGQPGTFNLPDAGYMFIDVTGF